MMYTHVLNRGSPGVVSPVDVVLDWRLPAERPGVVQIDGEASPPIARSTARMAIDDRRQIEDLSENARAPVARNRQRPRRREWHERAAEARPAPAPDSDVKPDVACRPTDARSPEPCRTGPPRPCLTRGRWPTRARPDHRRPGGSAEMAVMTMLQEGACILK